MTERTLKLVIEYDGTDFVGWQAQQSGVSIQQCVQQALQTMTGVKLAVRAAGRTDSGVHARAQVVSFRTESALPVERFCGGLNALLPKTISVHSAEEMPIGFDAKRDSRWKKYRYTIYQARFPAAHSARYSWHIIQPLDCDAMRAAAKHLVGELDFQAFRAAHCQAEHARREMFAITIERRPRPPAGEDVRIVYHANAFVQHMCRILTGTLVEVGRGERTPDSMIELLRSRDRKLAGMTAPARGLCMMEVGY